MAVALVDHFEGGINNTSPQSSSQTIGASSTLLLGVVAFAATSTAISTSPTMTWNGATMTLIASKVESDNLGSIYVFGIVNPSTGGPFNLTVSFTPATGGTPGGYLALVTFSGTDVSSVANAVPAANVLTDASTPTGTVYPTTAFSVTTANGDAVFAAMNSENSQFSTMNLGTLLNTDGALTGNITDGYRLATTSSTTIQFGSGTSGNPCCGVAMRISQPASANPFFLQDFQPTRAIRVTPNDASRPTNLELFKNPIPLGPYDWNKWPPQKPPPEPPPFFMGMNPNLFKNPIPFGPYDYSKGPTRVPEALRDLSWPLNLNLYKNPIPFGPFDYNKPFAVPSVPPLFPQPPNYVLFYANPVPFAQYDWKPAAMTVPNVPPFAQQPHYPEFYPNPIPFGPYDYNKPMAVPSVPPLFPQPANYVNFYPNPIPFLNNDYSDGPFFPKFPPPVMPPVSIALTSVVVQNPFSQTQWPATYFPRNQVDATAATNINLFANPIPFAQLAWPNVAPPPNAPPPVSLALNIGLFPPPSVQAPFVNLWAPVAQLLPTPPDPYMTAYLQQPLYAVANIQLRVVFLSQPFTPIPSRPELQPYNLALLSGAPPPPAPFIPVDWSKPFFPRTQIDATRATNPNLFTNPIPFAQYDWARPIAMTVAPPPVQPPVALVLYANLGPFTLPDFGRVAPFVTVPAPLFPQTLALTQTGVPAPFVAIDWSRPFMPRALVDPPMGSNPLLFTNPVPFGPYDYNKIQQPAPWRADPAPLGTNINLFGNPIPFFNTMDFRSPARPQWQLVDQGPPNMMLLTATVVVAPTEHNAYFLNISFGKLSGM